MTDLRARLISATKGDQALDVAMLEFLYPDMFAHLLTTARSLAPRNQPDFDITPLIKARPWSQSFEEIHLDIRKTLPGYKLRLIERGSWWRVILSSPDLYVETHEAGGRQFSQIITGRMVRVEGNTPPLAMCVALHDAKKGLWTDASKYT